MSELRLALVGFGNVGQGLARILADHGSRLEARHGLRVRITAVSDVQRGSLHEPSGLDPETLLSAVARDGTLHGIAARDTGWDALTTIRDAEADVVAEMSFTDLSTGEPALSHVREALSRGRHVITTNKGPVALRFPELLALARGNGVRIEAEGTVMSGTPALHLGTESLAGAGVRRIEGILNGTTNYILTRMEEGLDYDAALREAQAEGYAEADPTGDVEGVDAAGKVVILANLVLGGSLTMDDVEREGIGGVSAQDVREAGEAGERWKLIGTVEATEDGVRGSVGPRRLKAAHPLASVRGATNAITYGTDLLGDVTLIGPGAGRLETGYALISDLLAIHRHGGSPA